MLTHVFVPLTILSRGFLFGGLESFVILQSVHDIAGFKQKRPIFLYGFFYLTLKV